MDIRKIMLSRLRCVLPDAMGEVASGGQFIWRLRHIVAASALRAGGSLTLELPEPRRPGSGQYNRLFCSRVGVWASTLAFCVIRWLQLIHLHDLSLSGASAVAFSCFSAVLPLYCGHLCITARCISARGFGTRLALRFEIRLRSLFSFVLLNVCFGKHREGCTVVICVASAWSPVRRNTLCHWTFPQSQHSLSNV